MSWSADPVQRPTSTEVAHSVTLPSPSSSVSHCGVVERLLGRHGYTGLLEGRNETIQCELSAVARAGDWLALRLCRLMGMAVFEKNAEDAVADTVTATGQRNAAPPGWCYDNGKGESQHPAQAAQWYCHAADP